MYSPKKCKNCLTQFIPRSSRSVFCGSYKLKTGCSYSNRLKLSKESATRNKEYIKKYQLDYKEENKDHLVKYRADYYIKRKMRVRERMLKKNYNLSQDEYNKMLKAQDYKCLICSATKSKNKKSMPVDHDHDTNKIRGILCDMCNRALGMFKDNPTNLLNAYNYLKLHGK